MLPPRDTGHRPRSNDAPYRSPNRCRLCAWRPGLGRCSGVTRRWPRTIRQTIGLASGAMSARLLLGDVVENGTGDVGTAGVDAVDARLGELA